MDQEIQGDQGCAAEGTAQHEGRDPAEIGQLRGQAHDQQSKLIAGQGDGAAQDDGAGAAVPVHLAENTGRNAQDRDQGDAVGPRGGAGIIVKHRGDDGKETACFAAFQHGDQQNGADCQIGGGPEEGGLAHDHILDDLAQHDGQHIQSPLGQLKLLQVGQTQSLDPGGGGGIRLEFHPVLLFLLFKQLAQGQGIFRFCGFPAGLGLPPGSLRFFIRCHKEFLTGK